ncbi:MAG: reprolysin-like metallopeptidase [Bacteroidota bacterium]
MLRILLLCGGLLLCSLATAQSSAFSFVSTANAPTDLVGNALPLSQYGEVLVDRSLLTNQLAQVPLEGTTSAGESYVDLPTPEGEMRRFQIIESPIMQPGLAARYPELKSYRVIGPQGTGRMAVSPFGVTAAIMGEEGEYFINRAEEMATDHHLVYYTKDVDLNLGDLDLPALGCGWDAAEAEEEAIYFGWNNDRSTAATNAAARSTQSMLGLHVYEFALVCTGEFANLKGGTLTGVMNAYNEAMTVLNGILEREVGIRFMLIENNDSLIYLDADTDPFNNANNGGALLGQVAGAISLAGISQNAFDLAHLFTASCTDVGGVVSGAACTEGKTRGVTCNFGNNIAAVARGTMAHEIAHQFGVGHSWSNCPGSEGQLASSSAFEPGAGTTIMSYAGACGNQNIGGRDAYYHIGSVDQFINFSRNVNPGGCVTVLTPENNEPVISLPYTDGFYIPILTPFELEGSATDADGDDLLYNWEQYDLGPSSPLGDPFANSPLFRSYPPSRFGATRTVPRIDRIINNTLYLPEQLPDYSRDITFRFSVRDQNPAVGSTVAQSVSFRSTDEAGPFLVTSPNLGNEVWQEGDFREVTWDVANTNQGLVNCQSVNILLSRNGGQSYPIVLAENAPNNGRTFVTIPIGETGNNYRIKVAAADNIFFDISNQSFRINPATVPSFSLSVNPLSEQICLPDATTLTFSSGSILGFENEIELALVSSLPAGVVANFDNATLVPGESANLELDFSDASFEGDLEVMVQASAAGVDTTFRTVLLDVVNNDFSDLRLTSPAEGTQGILLTTDFDWTDAQYANAYDIQIATNADFNEASIFEEAFDFTENAYEQDEFFAANQLYFWRVRPTNECGPSRWGDPSTFRTVSAQCDDYVSNDTPVLMPGSGGTYTRSTSIFVDQMGQINDVNLPNVDINYQFMRNIKVTLVSPNSTRVVLYDENCFFTTRMNIGFDDDAPMDIICPPDDNRVFRPVESLSAFDNEQTFGTWTLEVAVSETGGSVGSIDDWSIEFCTTSTPATPPTLVLNDESEVPPGAGTNITGQVLRAEDNNFNASELEYTLVRAPLHGFLRLGTTEISAGARFTQEQISGAQLFYQNTNAAVSQDDWSFIVQNPEGGYIPVNYNVINIFEGAISSTEDDAVRPLDLELFPNPVTNRLQVRWGVSLGEDVNIELIDVAGRRLIQQKVAGFATNHSLDMQALPAGIYFVRMGGVTQRVVKH